MTISEIKKRLEIIRKYRSDSGDELELLELDILLLMVDIHRTMKVDRSWRRSVGIKEKKENNPHDEDYW